MADYRQGYIHFVRGEAGGETRALATKVTYLHLRSTSHLSVRNVLEVPMLSARPIQPKSGLDQQDLSLLAGALAAFE